MTLHKKLLKDENGYGFRRRKGAMVATKKEEVCRKEKHKKTRKISRGNPQFNS
jgi:hypothetical protein